jgi:hypothetical protein
MYGPQGALDGWVQPREMRYEYADDARVQSLAFARQTKIPNLALIPRAVGSSNQADTAVIYAPPQLSGSRIVAPPQQWSFTRANYNSVPAVTQAMEVGRYSYPVFAKSPTGFVNGNARSFRPGEVDFIPQTATIYGKPPSNYPFFYSETKNPGLFSLPRVPTGLEHLQEQEQPRYPTAHAGVDITNALVNPGKKSRHDVETDRYFADMARESPIAIAPPMSLPSSKGETFGPSSQIRSSRLPRAYETTMYQVPGNLNADDGGVIRAAWPPQGFSSAVSGGYLVAGYSVPEDRAMTYVERGNPQPEEARSNTATEFSSLGSLFNAAWTPLPPRPVRQTTLVAAY